MDMYINSSVLKPVNLFCKLNIILLILSRISLKSTRWINRFYYFSRSTINIQLVDLTHLLIIAQLKS